MAEFEFIAWLRQELQRRDAGAGRDTAAGARTEMSIAPGDDAAELLLPRPNMLLAADMLMAGVHFDLQHASPRDVGRKSLAVNLSDIAAMAGTPCAATLSLALPRGGGESLAQEVALGFIDLAAQYGVILAGGDTNTWDGPLVVSVSILGTPHARGSVRRAGAQPGDWICVTGSLGGSLASGRHLTFTPRCREARQLHTEYGLNAMLDLSDGLGSDLRHILRESRVSGILHRHAIPVHPELAGVLAPAAARARALSDGEDFELCFTLPAAAGARLVADQPFLPALRVSHVGQIVAAKGPGGCLTWDDGQEVSERGYQHGF